MAEDYGPQTRISLDEVDDWIKNSCKEYGPDGLVLDDVASIDLKTTKLRGKSKTHAMNMIFHVDFQEEIFFSAMNVNQDRITKKCYLKDWRAALEGKDVTPTE